MNKVKVKPSEPNLYQSGVPMGKFYTLLIGVESRVVEQVAAKIRNRVEDK